MRGSVFDAGCSEVMNQEGPEPDEDRLDDEERNFVWKCRCRFCKWFSDPDLIPKQFIEHYCLVAAGWNPFCDVDADNEGRECPEYQRRS